MGERKGHRPFDNIFYWGGLGEEEKRDVGTQQREKGKEKIFRMCNIAKVCIYVKL